MTNSPPISLIGPLSVFVSHRLDTSCLPGMPRSVGLDAASTETRAERYEISRGLRIERGAMVGEIPDSA